MIIENYDGIMTAISEIFQGGNEKTGASQLFNRQEVFWQGEKIELPYISGNSIRGILRRLIMEDFLDQIGYKFTQLDVFHSFFDGGALQSIGSEGGILDLDLRNAVIKLIPAAHLWGFSLGNQQINSNLQVKQGKLLCVENKFRVAKKYHDLCEFDHYAFLGQNFFTRKDESGLAGIKKGRDDPTIQMKVDLEVLIPGTKFLIGFVLISPTTIEQACLARALELWQQIPVVGGRSKAGMGEIELSFELASDSTAYLEYLQTHKEEICQFLDTLQTSFASKKKKGTKIKTMGDESGEEI